MSDFPQLTEEDFQQFDQLLHDLLAKSEANLALIVEKAGHLIHQCGDPGPSDPTLLATLASNAYNATAFMANLSGESAFSDMYQQGELFSTLIMNIDEHCLLVIIFNAHLAVGAVKYYAKTTISLVAKQLARAEERAPGVGFDLTDLNVTDAKALFLRKDAPEEDPAALANAGTAAFIPAAVPEPEPPVALAPEPEPPSAPVPTLPVEDPDQVVVAKAGPFITPVTPGTYYWCSCGRSLVQPFCDGSHAGTRFQPLAVEITNEQKRAFCGCKHSQHPPFCDGAHNRH
jgi:CDGSH-type Zn-finger protein/predicted regulator of Ras-like GTPase activity (Roadblock/LC7/MglB family)